MRLRATYRFNVGGDLDSLKETMKIVVACWKLLKLTDHKATLRVEPDSEDSDGSSRP